MRWGYLIPRVLILALIWAFFAFAFDPLLRYGMIAAGQQALGARVEIDRLATTFFPPSLKLAGLRCAAPNGSGRNVLDAEHIALHLAGKPLLKKSYIIDHGSVTGLRFDTARGDNGLLHSDEDGVESSAGLFDQLAQRAQDMGHEWFRALTQQAEQQLDPDQLETVRVTEQKRKKWEARFADWEARSEALKERVELIETNSRKKGNTLERLQAYERVAADVQQVLAESRRLRAELEAIGPTVQNDWRDIDQARQNDIANAQKKLALLRLDPDAISETFLGPKLAGHLAEAARWLDWIGKTAQAPVDMEPARYRGIDVEFGRTNPLPRFLARELALAGEVAVDGTAVPFHGVLRGATTDPQLSGRPTVLQMSAEASGRWELLAQVDRTSEIPRTEVEISFGTQQPTEFALGQPEQFVLNGSAGAMRWQAHLAREGDVLSGRFDLRQEPLQIVADSQDEQAARQVRLVNAVLSSVRHIDAVAEFRGDASGTDWRLRSNMGQQLADGLGNVLGQELARQQAHLIEDVDRVAQRQTDELRQFLNGRYGEVVQGIAVNETSARRLIENVAELPLDFKGLLRR